MGTYVAFLRAINLGARRVFPQGDIQRVVAETGFENVETHINTGNVRFESRMRSRAKIEAALERAFAHDRGFDVPVIVYSVAEFVALAADAEELSSAHPGLARHYVYLLKTELDPATVREVEGMSTEKGQMLVRGRSAHALLQPGYQNGQVDPLGAAKRLGVATNRNLTVVQAIAQKWCGR